MIIKIVSPTEEDPEKIFARFKEICTEELQKFELSIEGTDKIINLSPSIPNLSEDSLRISGSQVPYFRTDEFKNLLEENEKLILKLMGCRGKVIFLTGSGTLGMDSVVSNLIAQNEKVLIINGGSFGQRWVNICTFYGLNIREFKLGFGKDVDFPALEYELNDYKPNVLLVQHTETSSGIVYDIEKITKLCKEYNTKLFVDAISSFLNDKYDMDKLGVDATIISTQKGLGLFPGLSMVILSDKVIREGFQKKNFYFDYEKYLKEKLVTPFTPNVPVLLQLNERLKNLNLDNEIKKRKELASHFRNLIKDLPVKIIAKTPSNAVTGLYVERNDVKDFFGKMCKKNIFFSPIKNNAIVVSHMGNHSKEDYKIFVEELEKWLKGDKPLKK